MEGTSTDFGFSRAVREWCFVQLPLLDIAKFRKEAKARGLSDLGLFDRDPWETLDREELLVPVAYARHGMWHYDALGCLADGDLAVREEVGYRPWAQLAEEAEAIGQDAVPQVLYHHWQLFWLADLQDYLTPAVAWSRLGEGLDDFYEARAKIATAPDPLPLAPEFVLWKDNFEADNFTIGELCRVAEQFAAEIGLEGFVLDSDALHADLEGGQQEEETKGIASLVLDQAAEKDSRFYLSKPEFAERLALFALENPEPQEGKRRPILELAEHLVQLTWADRRLAGMLRRS